MCQAMARLWVSAACHVSLPGCPTTRTVQQRGNGIWVGVNKRTLQIHKKNYCYNLAEESDQLMSHVNGGPSGIILACRGHIADKIVLYTEIIKFEN